MSSPTTEPKPIVGGVVKKKENKKIAPVTRAAGADAAKSAAAAAAAASGAPEGGSAPAVDWGSRVSPALVERADKLYNELHALVNTTDNMLLVKHVIDGSGHATTKPAPMLSPMWRGTTRLPIPDDFMVFIMNPRRRFEGARASRDGNKFVYKLTQEVVNAVGVLDNTEEGKARETKFKEAVKKIKLAIAVSKLPIDMALAIYAKPLPSLQIKLQRDFNLAAKLVMDPSKPAANKYLGIGLPRGLINGANACFVASVLQMLMTCPAFCNVCISAAAAYDRYAAEHHFALRRRALAAAAERAQFREKQPPSSEEEQKLAEQQAQREAREQLRAKEDGQGDVEADWKPALRDVHDGAPYPPLPDEPTASVIGRWLVEKLWPMPMPACALPQLRVLPRHEEERLSRLSAKERKKAETDMSGLVQQDAHEFLQMLFDRVDDDVRNLNLNFQRDEQTVEIKNIAPAETAAKPAAASASSDGVDEKDKDAPPAVNLTQARDPCNLIFGGELFVTVTERANDGGSGGAGKPLSTNRIRETFTIMPVPVGSDPNASVQSCLMRALEREQIESARGDKVHTRSQQMRIAPQYSFIIQLLRWGMREDPKTKMVDVYKKDTPIKIDETLEIKIFDGRKEVGVARYRLRAVLCHRGRYPAQGHYVTYVKQTNGEMGFMLHNDIPPEFVPEAAAASTGKGGKAAGGGSAKSRLSPAAQSVMAMKALPEKDRSPVTWLANDSRISIVTDMSVIDKDTPYLLHYVRDNTRYQ